MLKAGKYAEAMEEAMRKGSWSLAAHLGAHAAMSASDALTSHLIGKHSTAQGHDEAVKLIARLTLTGASQRSDQLQQILAVRGAATYDDREISEAEASTVAKQVRRFMEWVESILEAKP